MAAACLPEQMNRRLWSLAMTGGFMLAVLAGAVLPDTSGTPLGVVNLPSKWQNILHLPVFGLLGILWVWVLRSFDLARRNAAALGCGLAAGYAGLIELAQVWIPGRFPSLVDYGMGLIGIAGFVGMYLTIRWGERV